MDELAERFRPVAQAAADIGIRVDDLERVVDARLVVACRTDEGAYVYVGDVAWLVSLRRDQPEVVRQLVAGEWIGLVPVARRLGLTVRQLYAMVDSGELPVHQLGKHFAVRRSDLERMRLLQT
jgi:excisionase family DNA binding protein